ncbi:type VI secretion system tip protein VgrG [Trinickia violacea]|uniref:Type VI secretion system tip protein VgrG n=1 Tax=Trinickia violacea TaxID=2571746 RepID=A0A4P8IX66_9BURK|nr:type VI secretion system tip protein TssI/VgrG [Trinickia violacea]QCP52083.1 type VI secretion system tip protein VgrG [Trinickia violacea]
MQAANATQAGCLLSISTPFGKDVLLLDGLGGREAISAPFHFDLRMRSPNRALDAQAIVGKNATVTLQVPSGPKRYLHGIVTRFAQIGTDAQHGFYTAELAPRLWLLGLGSDRAIYQNLSALDIVEQVLQKFGVAIELRVKGTYAVREYCVQYDESALQFISRLMEEEGIFYFFTFADGVHTMVLGDSTAAHKPGKTDSHLWYSSDSVAHRHVDRIDAFEMTTGLVEAEQIVADYDYTKAALLTANSAAGSGPASGTRYTFPGGYATAADGTRTAKLRLAAQQVGQRTGRASSGICTLTAGASFTLGGHANAAFNASYVIRAVSHSASNNDRYDNTFDVIPASVAFRPPLVTPKPTVAGTHTAIVTGSSGEEIWTDAYGRIKLKFHWDRSAGANENSSCWVRVAQVAAGNGWGHLVLPRVGQEVVVSYVDGDPDRPLVTGSVYNRQGTLPVGLPASQTQSVMRSRSSKGGTAGNEIRMDDKLNSEELYFHAQKDLNIAVENALSTTVLAGAETHVVKKGDRTVDVQKGNETHKVKGTRSVDVTGDEAHTNHAAFVQKVGGNYTLKVSGNLVIDVTGSISIKAGTSLQSQAGTTLANKAGTTLSNEALQVQSKASAMQTIDGGPMLALKGVLVKLN